MKKINDILTNYFFINLISILGNLNLFILLFYIFILYPLATSNLPENIDSFDVLYGMVMEMFEIFEYMSYIIFVLIIFIAVEFIIQRYVRYKLCKIVQNKVYRIFFYVGLIISIILIANFIFA